ncbi:hypothetical protein JWG45_11445 [Leptospira sp. 201903070]|uniref:Lipoprotein n=1 Tax=Leptospira ainlahdjerensis TaxID=2810033 RepID=A0ABS2UBN0_9LEPT|nr:hypothetical protein [Leptospira ainlahdjerensis]MBM9577766.1 hypothetical protein [Leptospira ainlahdjerensis]
MKQDKNKSHRRIMQITAFATTLLFSITSCKKDKKDDTNLLLMAALLGGNKAEFKLTNLNKMATGRIGSSQQDRSLLYSNQLVDLSGNDPLQYGDGEADGFTDHFMTPNSAGIEVCQIVAYKSVAKGGPAPGTETLKNINWSLRFGGGEYGPCSGMWPVGLTGGQSQFLDLHNPIPSELLQDFDRIGIVAHSFVYYLSTEQTSDSSYRYVSLFLNNLIKENNIVGGSRRGRVGTKIFSKGCPETLVSSNRYIFFNPMEMMSAQDCRISEAMIDSKNGLFLTNLPSKENFYNPPMFSGSAYSEELNLEYKLSPSVAAMDPKDPYIIVVPFDTSKAGGGKILFEVSVDNVLFWDSNDGNNTFSPESEVADRPNGTSGSENLTNNARKNLIFNLPTITSSLK